MPLLQRAAPYLAIIGAALGLIFYVNGLRSTVAKQGEQIAQLDAAIAAEKLARRKDIAGLTALSSGLATAAVDNAKDAAVMKDTINATNPQPVSAGLRSLLDCLRTVDRGGECAPATASR